MPESIVAETELPNPEFEEAIHELLTFQIRGESFGVPLTDIHEILGIRVLTNVPRSPKFVLGVCTVRGELITVLDTGYLLRVQGSHTPGKEHRILLAEAADGEKLGLLVDDVHEVRRLLDSQIESTETALVRDISPHLSGIGRQDGKLTVLVNLTSLVDFATAGPNGSSH